jgi:hypothetical protein
MRQGKEEDGMGSAAYRRGSQVIAQQLDQEQRPVEFLMMEELNALPKYPDAGSPFGPICFTYLAQDDAWWALDPVKLWGGRGFRYRSLREAVMRWYVTLTVYDATSQLWHAVPRALTRHEQEARFWSLHSTA